MASRERIFWGAAAAAVASGVCLAMIMDQPRGTWPQTWPESLEAFRERAHTTCIAHGIQEEIYEIPFADREEFEAVWPDILSIVSRPTRLTLYSIGDPGGPPTGPPCDNDQPAVRILAPPQGSYTAKGGQSLNVGPPWPKSVLDPDGKLPEYVTVTAEGWARPGAGERGFLVRARVDLELVVDGKLVDLNRIRVPADCTVVDRRKLPGDPPTTAPAGGPVRTRKTMELEAAVEGYLRAATAPAD